MAVIDNLVVYYECNEASGDLIDAHATHDLTDHGTVGATTGKVSGARDFVPANSEYFSLADNADISTGDIDFTWAGWVYFDALSTFMDFLTKWDSQFEYFIRRRNDNQLQFFVSWNGTADHSIIHSAGINTATWYFVAAQHDSVNNLLKLRIDATMETTGHTLGVIDSNAPLQFGAILSTGTTDFLDGRMDEWGFWKRILTDAELDWLYNTGNGRSYADIVAESSPATIALPGVFDPDLIPAAWF
jgi:concanavalin A-like lectin/glucanase superfamily protein